MEPHIVLLLNLFYFLLNRYKLFLVYEKKYSGMEEKVSLKKVSLSFFAIK